MLPTDEELPKGRPWLLAVGVGLVVVAGLGAWYVSTRKPCDCEEGEGAEDEISERDPNRAPSHWGPGWFREGDGWRRITARGPVQPPQGNLEPDPLAWDTHAERAWGAAPAGPQRLDAWAAGSDGEQAEQVAQGDDD